MVSQTGPRGRCVLRRVERVHRLGHARAVMALHLKNAARQASKLNLVTLENVQVHVLEKCF